MESNIKFNFNLFLAKDAFTFDNQELAKSSCEKKKSPSQLRREKKRKEERENKKEDSAKVYENLDPESVLFKCDHCDPTFKPEKIFKIKVGNHTKLILHKLLRRSMDILQRRSSCSI